MHPLTELLSNAHSDGPYITLHEDNVDVIVTEFLRNRAEWLKGQFAECDGSVNQLQAHCFDQAFGLEEETPQPKPELPGKIAPCQINEKNTREAINQLITCVRYLMEKE